MWQGKKKALTFSYDDGVVQDRRLVELFDRYGLKGTFNLNSGIFSTDEEEKGWNEWERGLWIARIQASEVSSLYQHHEVAVHTLTHANLTEVSDEQLARELADDKRTLEQLVGYDIVGMAYPYGTHDDRVVKAVQDAGLRYSRTVRITHDFAPTDTPLTWCTTCHHNDESLFLLAEQFLNMTPDRPQVFSVWGHSYEFDVNENWDRIERFCAMMANRDDIFYATNRDVLSL